MLLLVVLGYKEPCLVQRVVRFEVFVEAAVAFDATVGPIADGAITAFEGGGVTVHA
jgi:hypothetical protein